MSNNWNPNKQGKFRNSLGDEPKRATPQERNTFSTDVEPERAILVAVCPAGQTMERTEEYLAELAFLLDTAGGIALKKVIQRLERPDTRTYVGSGKLEELKEYKNALDADFIVVDDELSPAQLRNLEKELEYRILDRTTLILDIFAKRARTSIAKTQVELAQLQYMLPRLTRMWTHLERQRGGIGMRGPGETQIETDRRLIKERIAPFDDVPIIFTSVINKQRIFKVLEAARDVYEARSRRIPTSELNDAMLPIVKEQNPPPSVKGKWVKIKYVTQLPTAYPQFVFFCNLPQYIRDPYKRFVENRMRELWDFHGVPLTIYFRAK